ncbi:MAG: DUF2442 domain-containing protein [Caldilineaceae bacterium]|jgi:hypothetical protein
MITNHEDKLKATKLSFQQHTFIIAATNGEEYVIPYSVSPRLLLATQIEREAGELMAGGYGIEWEALNEHLSVDGLIQGKVSTETWRSVHAWYEMRRDEETDVELLLEPVQIFA